MGGPVLSLPDDARAVFAEIYSTDLVYLPDCWQLCGDAHCCSFARHKAKFRLLAGEAFQELPLLPGEWDFIVENGWDRQFGDHEFRASIYQVGGRGIRVESVVSRRPMCACDHATRTAVCRFYPLIPRFDLAGRMIGTEPLGVYEELERLDNATPACRVGAMDFDQLNLFTRLAAAIGRHPVMLFYLAAYSATKRHAVRRVEAAGGSAPGVSAFRTFETEFVRGRLLDHDTLRGKLGDLLVSFEQHYGPAFDQAWQELHRTARPTREISS